MIGTKEAIRILELERDDWETSHCTPNVRKDAFNEGIKALEESIPKFHLRGHKLCSFAKPNRIDKIYIDLAYWTGGRWYGYRSDAIIAWMPLPEPYRAERRTDDDRNG